MRISSSTRPIGGLVRFACLPLPSKKKQISPVAKPSMRGLATFFIESKSSKEIYLPVVTVDQQNLRERYSALWSSCPLEFKRVIGLLHAQAHTFPIAIWLLITRHRQTYTLL